MKLTKDRKKDTIIYKNWKIHFGSIKNHRKNMTSMNHHRLIESKHSLLLNIFQLLKKDYKIHGIINFLSSKTIL